MPYTHVRSFKYENKIRMTNLLLSPKGRMYAFGIMYLAEGIPYGFATTAMAMHMRMQGLSIEQIGVFVVALSVMPFLKNREKKAKSVEGVPVLAQSG